MLNEEQIKGKWTEIKGGIRNLWGNLTDDELEETKGNLHQVGGLIERKYGETKETIREKMDRLMNSFDNDTDKGIDIDRPSYERSPTEPRTAAKSEVQDEYQDIKTRSPERAVFDRKVSIASQESQSNPRGRSNYAGANPGRDTMESGTGAADRQDSSLHDVSLGAEEGGGEDSDREDIIDADQEDDGKTYEARVRPAQINKADFNSDRNARH
jgi:uncharacterized protein YjbJ (UPF0337 family)